MQIIHTQDSQYPWLVYSINPGLLKSLEIDNWCHHQWGQVSTSSYKIIRDGWLFNNETDAQLLFITWS